MTADVGDVKDMKVAGCDVHLTFVQARSGWTVVGTLASGTAENKTKQSITSGPWATRDVAEKEALEEIAKLLGNNEDRHTSRIHNPGEESTTGRLNHNPNSTQGTVSELESHQD